MQSKRCDLETAEMSQICIPDAKVLQNMEAVGDLLQEGLKSICNICTFLFNAHVDHNTGKCSDYKHIREHIKNAEECLKRSENMTKGKLGNLNNTMEQLLNNKKHFEDKKKENNLTMDELHKNKKSAEETLSNLEAALKQAKTYLATEKEALEKEEARRDSSKDLAVAGAVVTIVPIVGWIAGPIMLSAGIYGMEVARKRIRATEVEIEKTESQVRTYNSKVSDYESKISVLRRKIEMTDIGLNEIQKEIERLQQHLVVTAEIQKRVSEAVHLLSILSGRVTVLETQTQCSICWNPVMKVMEDVMKAAINIAENQFLYRQGLPGLINTLKENIGGLLAICNSPKNSEYDNYY